MILRHKLFWMNFWHICYTLLQRHCLNWTQPSGSLFSCYQNFKVPIWSPPLVLILCPPGWTTVPNSRRTILIEMKRSEASAQVCCLLSALHLSLISNKWIHKSTWSALRCYCMLTQTLFLWLRWMQFVVLSLFRWTVKAIVVKVVIDILSFSRIS